MYICGLQKSTLLDFPEHIACTIFTGGCNFKCPWCHNKILVNYLKLGTQLSDAYIFDFLNSRIGILDGVAITGGEPLMQSDIQEFISKIKDLGFKVKIDTNGYFPNILLRLLDSNLVDYVAMDVKNCRGKYSETCGLNNMETTLIWDSIDIIKNWGGEYEFRTTVIDELHTEEDIDQIGRWVEGAKRHYIQPYKQPEDIINESEVIFHTPENSKLFKFQDILSQYVQQVEIRGVLV